MYTFTLYHSYHVTKTEELLLILNLDLKETYHNYLICYFFLPILFCAEVCTTFFHRLSIFHAHFVWESRIFYLCVTILRHSVTM